MIHSVPSLARIVLAADAAPQANSNFFLWFLCALGFLKVSQHMDGLLGALGLHVSKTGGSMLEEVVHTGRTVMALLKSAGGALGARITGFAGGSGDGSGAFGGDAASPAAGADPIASAGGNTAAAIGAGPATMSGSPGSNSSTVPKAPAAAAGSSTAVGAVYSPGAVGTVARGKISKDGKITGEQASAALTSYLGYSTPEGAASAADTTPAVPSGTGGSHASADTAAASMTSDTAAQTGSNPGPSDSQAAQIPEDAPQPILGPGYPADVGMAAADPGQAPDTAEPSTADSSIPTDVDTNPIDPGLEDAGADASIPAEAPDMSVVSQPDTQSEADYAVDAVSLAALGITVAGTEKPMAAAVESASGSSGAVYTASASPIHEGRAPAASGPIPASSPAAAGSISGVGGAASEITAADPAGSPAGLADTGLPEAGAAIPAAAPTGAAPDSTVPEGGIPYAPAEAGTGQSKDVPADPFGDLGITVEGGPDAAGAEPLSAASPGIPAAPGSTGPDPAATDPEPAGSPAPASAGAAEGLAEPSVPATPAAASAPNLDPPPRFRNVEIGGGRITGWETPAYGGRERRFAMYSAAQYMAPEDPYEMVQTADGATWYRQYERPVLRRTPVPGEDGALRYQETWVSGMPKIPRRKTQDGTKS